MQKFELRSPEIGNKTRISILTTSSQYYSRGHRHCHQARKINKRHEDSKGGRKIVPLCRSMIVYVKTSRKSMTTTRINNEFSKFTHEKVNIQNSTAFLYVIYPYVLAENNFKKLIPFSLAAKKIKYLGINLTK